MPTFKSKFETSVYEAAIRSGKSLEYETVVLDYTIRGKYHADWLLPNGIIVETKGYLDAAAAKKMIAVKTAHPDLDIRIVFQNASMKRNKRAKMTYGEWATKHGFIWSQGTIPLSWFKEKRKNVSKD